MRVWAVSLSVLFGWQMATAAELSTIDFTREIRPILSNHCWSCHGPDAVARKAGLRLDHRDAALQPAESGSVPLVPGKPEASELIARIDSTDDDLVMPPPSAQKPLSPSQRQLLKRWISEGAVYAQHWAFTTPQRPELPAVQKSDWARDEVDYFVLHRLEQEGLSPSPEADRATWLRRVTLDLTGLPPEPTWLEEFLADKSASAYESVVDRLLASPQHAERMAMHWLDAARYADTNGYNNDEMRTMWPWRDWVIRAFQQGMPYDQFLTEQLAGDLLPDATLDQKVATGFNRNHVLTTEGGIIEEEYRVEYVADRVHTTATAFLGLSLQCARCHDHKFDPFSQHEYYRFAAYFNNIPDKVVGYSQGKMAEPLLRLPSPEQQATQQRLDARRDEIAKLLDMRAMQVEPDIAAWEKLLTAEQAATSVAQLASGQTLSSLSTILNLPSADRSAEQRNQVKQYYLDQVDSQSRQLKTERADVDRQRAELDKAITVTMVMREMEPRRATHILRRGQYDQVGEEVSPGVPAALSSFSSHAVTNRLELARWLTDPSHPLTARVAVNRWWEMLFGVGLVETVEDFGVQGNAPTHPQLLDWLATELIRRKWDQRSILKLLVLSATYRQSSQVTPELLSRDPHNRLLARGPRYRLPAETVRDNALAISGLLREQVGGASVKPYQPEGLWEDVSVERREKYKPDLGDGLYRRSMYTFWKRTCPPPSMSAFDAPDRETCVIRRARTNTPLQALVLLNDPTYVEAARKFAERVLKHASTDDERIEYAIQLALARAQRPNERAILLEQLQIARQRFRKQPAEAEKLLSVGYAPRDATLDVVELAAWSTVTSMLLNLDEAISKR